MRCEKGWMARQKIRNEFAVKSKKQKASYRYAGRRRCVCNKKKCKQANSSIFFFPGVGTMKGQYWIKDMGLIFSNLNSPRRFFHGTIHLRGNGFDPMRENLRSSTVLLSRPIIIIEHHRSKRSGDEKKWCCVMSRMSILSTFWLVVMKPVLIYAHHCSLN